MKRKPTRYPGVFYREAERIGGTGRERVYYIVFKKDGQVFEEKVGRQYADDMTEARANRIRAERIEGKRLSRREVRWQEQARVQAEHNRYTIDRLWEQYKTGNPNLKGIVTDENRYAKHIAPLFGSKEPRSLVPLDVDRLRLKLQKDHAPATVRNTLELLRRIVNFGVRKHLCEGLKFTLQMPRVANTKTEDLSPEQLASLLRAIDDADNIHAANIMRLALFSGMRRGEMFRLQWQDIDFDRGFIHLRDPKGGVDQKIPLNDPARTLLLSHPREDSDYVFPGRGGRQRTDIKKQVNRIKEQAGLPKEFRALHGLRHVYASMLASSGEVDMYTLQKLLTHKGPAMTQRYAHLRDDALRRASDLAGTLVVNATETDIRKDGLKLA